MTTPYHDGAHEGRAANEKQEDGAGEHLHQAATATRRDAFLRKNLRLFRRAGEHLHHAATATLRDVFLGKRLRRFRCGGAAPKHPRVLPRDAYR